MGSRLVVEVQEKNDISFVKLTGIIDEDNDLAEVIQKINKAHVVINTADLDRINSCGVRDWVNWLGDLKRKEADYYFVECSPAIMAQVNLVNNFVGSGTILSFYAPYFCSSCDTDKMLLIEVSEAAKTTPFRAPTCRCDQCDHTMEFDDIESSYFAFLNSSPDRPVESSIIEACKSHFADSDRLRGRTSPMPMVTPSTPSADSFSSLLTAPQSLRGLLTNSVLPDEERQVQPAALGHTLLYVIVGLLALAIGLLGYVVIRSL